MSNLNTKLISFRSIVGVGFGLALIAGISGCSDVQEISPNSIESLADGSARGLTPPVESDLNPDSTRRLNDMDLQACMSIETDPDAILECIDTYNKIGTYSTPPRFLEAPTTDYPFGGLEGVKFSIRIPQDGTVSGQFEELTENVTFPLSREATTELVGNLVAELDKQLGYARDLNLVYKDEIFSIDLRLLPSKWDRAIVSGELMENGGSNSSFDTNSFESPTNPSPETFPSEASSADGDIISEPLVADCENVAYVSQETEVSATTHGICMDE